MIHVFIGTKAQYIKMAPLLRRMEQERVPYRLIDTGQHAALARHLISAMEVRQPDAAFANGDDITTIPAALRWCAQALWWIAFRPQRIRHDIFAGQKGICVVHGDTPSTFIAALMAKRAGLTLAHVEAGLRSHRLFRPFPEELIRIWTMRMADMLFAPSLEAMQNIDAMRLKGKAVHTIANTNSEALAYAARETGGRPCDRPYAVVTLHRVENILSKPTLQRFVHLLERLAQTLNVVFVVHGPTKHALHNAGLWNRVSAIPGIELRALMPYEAFIGLVSHADIVLTDGGSVQEECAYLGVPALILRRESERPDGIGENARLCGFDVERIEELVENRHMLRRAPKLFSASPSAIILQTLLAMEGRCDNG